MTDWDEIPAIDRAFGKTHGKTPSEQLFLSFLLGLTRCGYLSYNLNANLPDPQEVYGALPALEEFKSCLRQGAHSPLVVEEENCYYLKRIYEARASILHHWTRLTFSCTTEADPSDFQQLTHEQRAALEMALSHSPFILTGGPGTGKTYTASCILKALLKSKPHQINRIAIAAPTGKAALHLETTLKKAVDLKAEAMTLHRLCNKSEGMLPYDLYLVDEASMIDLELMAKFLGKIRSGARLILLGDPDQLPPVECGSLFKELCGTASHVAKLTHCLRAELKELVDCAKALLTTGEFLPSEAVEVHTSDSLELEEMLPFFPKGAETFSPQLLSDFNRFRILSPMRKGSYGVEAVNRQILQKLWKSRGGSIFPVPILITANDPVLKLFNGETALLMTRHSPLEPPHIDDRIYFSDGRNIPALLLPHYELAYCITVHKSQGSEFDHVLLLLGDDPLSRKRELLYTAATRAKKKLTVLR